MTEATHAALLRAKRELSFDEDRTVTASETIARALVALAGSGAVTLEPDDLQQLGLPQ